MNLVPNTKTSAAGRVCCAPVIRTVSVTKHYKLGKDNHVRALRGASIEIAAGEMVAIVGPSGSGKSTMMHLIGCLDAPDSGEVHINGRRVDTLRGAALTRLRATEVGFIFQGFNLIPTMNAVDNVALAAEYAGAPRKEATTRAEGLLDLVGLGDRKHHLPGDLDTATSEEIVGLMRRINRTTGTTFVIVTHNPEVADACDRTIRMRDGVVECHSLPPMAATA